MSSVPYIFASQVGNIALSELDANFANVKASVDYATLAGTANTAYSATTAATAVNALVASSANTAIIATTAGNATTAGTVTNSAQPNITSVGTLTSVSITGNVNAGNLRTAGLVSSAGNITGGNVLAGIISSTGNILAGGIVSVAGNISVTGNLIGTFLNIANSLNANVANATYHVGNVCSISGNVTAGNIISAGKTQYTGLEIISPNYISVTGNAQTANLSATNSTNILIANNTGYTLTVNMPTGPVDGQITKFAISGNTVTLVLGTGTVAPTFAGSTTAGTAYTYVFRNSNTTWYRTN